MTTTTVLITGNTFPVKDALKALGARWDAAAKGWRVPAALEAKARQLVSGAPQSAPSGNLSSGYGRSRYGRRKACVSDGNCSSFGAGRSCGGHDCDGY